MLEWIILVTLGFIVFFATGIDDTLAYASSYINKKKDHKVLINMGILLGTFASLAIAVSAGLLMQMIPFRHLIGGTILIGLGMFTCIRKPKRRASVIKRIDRRSRKLKDGIKFIGLGLLLKLATGLDDTIAYANLILAKGNWVPICLGVIIGTIVCLMISNLLSKKIKKIPHPALIGGILMIIVGFLLAVKIL